ncbi:methionine ABC transporter ATP-binding protein [Alkalihalobacillus alcalophilus ATCC 27647 = CGMCC 1.3604]|uniref:D-methionine transporter n=1 Tax=Alkalihalobacillus alcalophilus ATCC 27647 = CGMCC 1.3604 TaxID=1218173 RepID=J8TQZ4_ALKAL|nr:methionine ABC transporter ATP-binding protein [Alkalihalobacillus alcalophilus]AFV25796.1 D-methionine transporter [Alkalihalobacillus alcalophilus ATCC 27647 = CGMCC 1.3604]KGA98164.1 methionine ABC transporter ATP-binding protein [Alkalihalobacillus alcalophilus ATCC 27647 = CGMCC 1.3604]MED1560842.1 methionine ABC transporter ATP-binding protein [Alkalihalobacillus alcalophilus]THG90537.1 methionine ABC transporter ATP-binding protein [Alkalihalobacillus alcalophilus ATCC 27647 = CGMCC 1
MIKVENLNKVFKTKTKEVIGLKEVSLDIKKGEIFGIVGYSGAGKSTLIRCLNILERPTSGHIYIDDVDLLSLSSKELREARQSIGMIFQGFYLVASKTVFDNVAFALKAAGVKSVHKRKERVTELLDLVGLADKANEYPAQLSGGQRQRVSIARALANNPKVLLCDEATSALDPTTTKSILALLKRINREFGITIVLITHEMEVVKEICHRCAVMQDGEIVEEGQTYDMFAEPENELTKKFIQTVLDFELPQKLLSECEGVILRLQFRGGIASDAVVSDMLQAFSVRGNILHGKVEYIGDAPLGIFIFELVGEEEEVNKAIAYLEERVFVEVIQDARH